ncbi:putative TIM-barrel fold metal-dependent hydrolase [Bosea sp. 124]|nr:putative TIM-barrel fold metal-dependent hydrolase [Bosea sp. 124]
MSGYRYTPENAPVFIGNFPNTFAHMNAWQALEQPEEVVDPDLPIIDAHHHLWDDKRGCYLLPELVEDIRKGGHNIISTVHVQAHSMLRASGPAEYRVLGETEFLRGVAAMSASGLYGSTRVCEGIVGEVDFRLGDAAGDLLDAHIEAGGGRFRGIRQGATFVHDAALAQYLPQMAQEHLLVDADFQRGFAQLGKRGLSFDAWVFHPQLDDVTALAQAFPDTKIVLDHIGGRLGIGPYAKLYPAEFERFRALLKRVAAQPNVFVKIGGQGMTYNGYGIHTLPRPLTSDELATAWEPYVMAGIEAFGPARCIMESNFPVDRQSCSYRTLWNALKKITASFSPDERNAMFAGNARSFYRLS